jgi:hypothetical protein
MTETPANARRYRDWLAPALAALLFALLSLAILPYPGLQDDEISFAPLIDQPALAWFSISAFGARIPVMIMSYSGTLKTWLYAGLFELSEPSRWSVRVPMVLVGIATVWLTWLWTRRIAGTRAAVFTLALLATDSIFILTNTFDWGPVAFQHLFLMGGLLAVQIWLSDDSKKRMLALGFFLWGFGLWDKALLIWPLIGLTVAAVIVYPRQLLLRLRRVPLAIAAAAFLLGALPLIVYNVAKPGSTASENTKLSLNSIPAKVHELRTTLDGSVLFDAMVSTTPGPLEYAPRTTLERASVWLKKALGHHQENRMLPAIALAMLGMIFLLRTPLWRPLAFLLIAMAVTWLQMALNAGTGGAAHHVILMWPFPCVFVGVALAGATDRAPRPVRLAINAVVILIASFGFLNCNEYLADLAMNGALGGWTDASYRLAGAVSHYQTNWIGTVDWGYKNGLRLWYGNDLKMFSAADQTRKPAMTDGDRLAFLTELASPNSVFIQHTDDKQLYDNVNIQLRDAALALGYTEQVERVVHDNQGRPVFEIFRFARNAVDAAPVPQ